MTSPSSSSIQNACEARFSSAGAMEGPEQERARSSACKLFMQSGDIYHLINAGKERSFRLARRWATACRDPSVREHPRTERPIQKKTVEDNDTL
eukprot:6611569-Pyramimonas_sp.AAC.1